MSILVGATSACAGAAGSQAAAADLGDPIGESLRFRSQSNNAGSYLHRTGFTDSSDVWTFSCWAKGWKAHSPTTSQDTVPIFSWHTNANNSSVDELGFFGNYPSSGLNELYYYLRATSDGKSYTNAKYNDPSAWYHIVWRATSTSDITLWINGVEVTSWRQKTPFTAQNFINKNCTCSIGGRGPGATTPGGSEFHGQGYMASVYFIDGQALEPTAFGRENANGVWVPREIDFDGNWGANGFHLDFADPNDIGKDISGNGNDFTATGFNTTASSTDYDLMQDSPTQNYATGNPLMHGRDGGTRIMSYTDANLGFLGGGPSSLPWTHPSIRVPMDVRAYAEFTNIAGAITAACGVSERRPTTDSGWGSNGCWSWALDTRVWIVKPDGSTDTVNVPGRWTGTAGDVAGVEVNTTVTPPTVTFTLNGANASTHTFNADFDPENIWIGGNFGANTVVQNFGQQPFQHQPTGTIALQTNNLPEPTIKNGKEYFGILTYAAPASPSFPITIDGSGGNNGDGELDFDGQPDLVWIKMRNAGQNNILFDSVRGTSVSLRSDGTNSEISRTNFAFATNGFTFSAQDAESYQQNDNYVAWCWKAGGTAVTNTDGTNSNTVSVSANQNAGFSIVTYTGETSNNPNTIGHGLNAIPEFILVKRRDAIENWAVYHVSLGNDRSLELHDSTGQSASSSAFWNSTTPTSSVFSVGNGGATNEAGGTYVAYVWAPKEGYSKFGKYTGNGSTDGVFVYLGFKPALLVIRSLAGRPWMVYDSARNTSNPLDNQLYWDQSSAENASDSGTSNILDFLSNGFKLRDNSGQTNASGEEYVFMAWAENPFGGENAPPATAR